MKDAFDAKDGVESRSRLRKRQMASIRLEKLYPVSVFLNYFPSGNRELSWVDIHAYEFTAGISFIQELYCPSKPATDIEDFGSVLYRCFSDHAVSHTFRCLVVFRCTHDIGRGIIPIAHVDVFPECFLRDGVPLAKFFEQDVKIRKRDGMMRFICSRVMATLFKVFHEASDGISIALGSKFV